MKEITDIDQIMAIMEKCDSLSLALFDAEYPYIVPMNFGVKHEADTIELYFHCASAGKKLELIKQNNHVAFEMSCSRKLVAGDAACEYSMEYESVCGAGRAYLLDDEAKLAALKHIMQHYTGKYEHEFKTSAVGAVTVFKVVVDELHSKALKR